MTDKARRMRLSDERAKRLDQEGKGLVCRKCNGRLFEVVYTRPTTTGHIKRQRRCLHCGRRMTTMEMPLRDAAKH